MNNLEILAPAGSMESLIAGVRNGANAVYLGAQLFSARSSAKNFNKDELKEAIRYCHIRDVKVYLTVNTLIHDDELENAINLIKYAANIGIDAIIIQDVGLAKLVRKAIPSINLNASTQMSVHTPMGAKFLYDMGYKRVVLSREMSESEIKEVSDFCRKNSSDIELEVFVHGALCMCVSGQCYLSAMLGSRSGNRGACAQPCRLPFAVQGGTGYDLSLKDLSLIHHLNELKQIGVTSIKIEGRMKRPEYVAAAVDCINDACKNGFVDNNKFSDLNAVFSRQGFTDGYFINKTGRDMFGKRTKEDVISATNNVFSKIKQTYLSENPSIPLKLIFTAKNKKPLQLTVIDDKNNSAVVAGNIPETAIKVALSQERCIAQLSKTGGTPFFAKEIICDIDDNLSVPISEINQLRKSAIEIIEDKRAYVPQIQVNDIYLPISNPKPKSKTIKNRAVFSNSDIPKYFKNFEFVFVPLTTSQRELQRLINEGFNIALDIPRCMFGREKLVDNLLEKAKSYGINDILVSNIGAVPIAKKYGFNMHGGFGLNITNTASLLWAEDVGFKDIELSFELTVSQINDMGADIPRGVIVYGHLPLMITRNCPVINNGNICHNCKTPQFITDRKGIKFPIKCNFGCSELFNSVPLRMIDRINEFSNIDFVIYRYTVENSVEILEKSKVFNINNKSENNFTRGLYYRGVE